MSKKYRVIVAPSAKLDALDYRNYIARDKPKAADRWLRKIGKLMQSLRFMPCRFERIPEADDLDSISATSSPATIGLSSK